MGKHIIKYDYKDGRYLDKPVVWCNIDAPRTMWLFQDAQHAALSAGGSIAPCKNCIKAIIKELQKEI